MPKAHWHHLVRNTDNILGPILDLLNPNLHFIKIPCDACAQWSLAQTISPTIPLHECMLQSKHEMDVTDLLFPGGSQVSQASHLTEWVLVFKE